VRGPEVSQRATAFRGLLDFRRWEVRFRPVRKDPRAAKTPDAKLGLVREHVHPTSAPTSAEKSLEQPLTGMARAAAD
jgi:hypothetical protein